MGENPAAIAVACAAGAEANLAVRSLAADVATLRTMGWENWLGRIWVALKVAGLQTLVVGVRSAEKGSGHARVHNVRQRGISTDYAGFLSQWFSCGTVFQEGERLARSEDRPRPPRHSVSPLERMH